MKQLHALMRLAVCLLLAVAYAKPHPASPEDSGAAIGIDDRRPFQAEADGQPARPHLQACNARRLEDADLSLHTITQAGRRSLC